MNLFRKKEELDKSDIAKYFNDIGVVVSKYTIDQIDTLLHSKSAFEHLYLDSKSDFIIFKGPNLGQYYVELRNEKGYPAMYSISNNKSVSKKLMIEDGTTKINLRNLVIADYYYKRMGVSKSFLKEDIERTVKEYLYTGKNKVKHIGPTSNVKGFDFCDFKQDRIISTPIDELLKNELPSLKDSDIQRLSPGKVLNLNESDSITYYKGLHIEHSLYVINKNGHKKAYYNTKDMIGLKKSIEIENEDDIQVFIDLVKNQHLRSGVQIRTMREYLANGTLKHNYNNLETDKATKTR